MWNEIIEVTAIFSVTFTYLHTEMVLNHRLVSSGSRVCRPYENHHFGAKDWIQSCSEISDSRKFESRLGHWTGDTVKISSVGARRCLGIRDNWFVAACHCKAITECSPFCSCSRDLVQSHGFSAEEMKMTIQFQIHPNKRYTKSRLNVVARRDLFRSKKYSEV